MKKFILIIRAIAKLVFVLAILALIVYIAACIVNIWLHNSTDYTYADWNYLVKILKEYFYN